MFNAVYIEEGVNNENLIIDLIDDNAQRFSYHELLNNRLY